MAKQIRTRDVGVAAGLVVLFWFLMARKWCFGERKWSFFQMTIPSSMSEGSSWTTPLVLWSSFSVHNGFVDEDGPHMIKVHCNSGENDLGERFLKYGEDYAVRFDENFQGRTAFMCRFKFALQCQEFPVWHHDERIRGGHLDRCLMCKWEVNAQGFHLRTHGNRSVMTTIHDWVAC